jgi:hypothetical protein
MDIAVRDDRAAGCGWVFGTFAFDRYASDADAWRRMRPVGMMWGNDPGYTPENQKRGDKLKETFISDQAPAYAKNHLGWAGRLNGVVDNPASACLSCHSTAEYPIDAVLTPPASCTTDEQKLYWFRNLPGTTAFGVVNPTNCQPEQAGQPPASLDLSLQIEVALQNLAQYHVKDPCVGKAEQYVPLLEGPPRPPPRVER